MTEVILGGSGQTQDSLSLILEMAKLIHKAIDMNNLASKILPILGRKVEAERGAFFEFSKDTSRIEEIASWGLASRKVSFDKGEMQRIKNLGQPVLWTDSIQTLPIGETHSSSRGEAKSILAAPYNGRNGLSGLLYFESAMPDRFEGHQLNIIAITAIFISLATKGSRRKLDWSRTRSSRSTEVNHGILGRSKPIVELHNFISKVAQVDSTVLVYGESGTGKELVAQAVHFVSPRAGRPMVAINCATLSDNLLESELFGHEKGAFTGASGRRIGKLEAAHGGTLFLDEIGELPLSLQARLLRVLQERDFERVGSNQRIQVDIRIVAATNRDLEAAVRDGTFREDLFHRLDVVSIQTPPLRERASDVELLARYFLRHHRERLGRPKLDFKPSALRHLKSCPWPGNVRQLSNTIERAVVLSDGEWIESKDLSRTLSWQKPHKRGPSPSSLAARLDVFQDYQTTMAETKRSLITNALQTADGNAAEAGRRLGLHPNSFRRLMRQLGLK